MIIIIRHMPMSRNKDGDTIILEVVKVACILASSELFLLMEKQIVFES